MDSHARDGGHISIPPIQHYLRRSGYPDALVMALQPLGETEGELKSYGYGRPLLVSFRSQGKTRQVVLRTMRPDVFGHDRRADRVESMLLAFDTFEHVPRHVHALDVGAFDEASNMVPIARGEPFLLTEYVPGDLYAKDLQAVAKKAKPDAVDLSRARALAGYLVELHKEPAPRAAYVRSIRDTVGHGEGIFGLADCYPDQHPVASRARIDAIELEAVRWRHKLRSFSHRARRTHGDFHPFNILFRHGADFSVLDASRGGVGDPADDVTCLAINYAFFALLGTGEMGGALHALWDAFFEVYSGGTGDQELHRVAPLFFTWRALVIASPTWYPGIDDQVRDRLLRFAERMLGGEVFAPERIVRLLS
jgi:aminoglycoside phosphotransferase (APT) family kinase protein